MDKLRRNLSMKVPCKKQSERAQYKKVGGLNEKGSTYPFRVQNDKQMTEQFHKVNK